MYAAAVTGTNGKTSTIEFARQLLARDSVRAVSVGTLGTKDVRRTQSTPFFLSRPGCWARYLDELAIDYDAAVLEAYSGGLAAGEWDGTPLNTAVLTTFGHDHFDVHGSRRAYARAKLRLFERGLPAGATAVVSTRCELAPHVKKIGRDRHHHVITYGSEGDVVLRSASPIDGGMAVNVEAFGMKRELVVSVSADFLVDNALAAVCVAAAAGVDVSTALDGLADVSTPPGRMQYFNAPSGSRIFVDLAHTPDGLSAVLDFARRLGGRRVIVVFGCGGGRDASKRPEMGRVAARLADDVIVTDDNVRTENAGNIRAEILEGCPQAEEIPDRITAIQTAVERSGPDDVLLVCGRGVEAMQNVGNFQRPCNDAEIVRRALQQADRALQHPDRLS